MFKPDFDVSATGTGELGLLPAREVVADDSGKVLVGNEVLNEVPADDREDVVDCVEDVVDAVVAGATFAPIISNPTPKNSVQDITNLSEHLNTKRVQRTTRWIRHEGRVPRRCRQISNCHCPRNRPSMRCHAMEC